MEFYHALNRGVDKRTIFLDSQDYARFVHDMFAFNNTKPASNTFRTKPTEMFDFVSRTSRLETEDAIAHKIVDIHGWCLMGNHYHLLLSERIPGGMVSFLRKLNIGYAKYFNERYSRNGTLFQGRTKKVHVATDTHLLHILNYIHLNPLDFHTTTSEWRSGKISQNEDVLQYLEKYKWSSYLDYAGVRNFPSILTTAFFHEVFEGDYSGQLKRYLANMDIGPIDNLLLE